MEQLRQLSFQQVKIFLAYNDYFVKITLLCTIKLFKNKIIDYEKNRFITGNYRWISIYFL